MTDRTVNQSLLWVLLFTGLYITARNNYLLFHNLVEFFTIIIGCGIFIVTWNSRRLLDNHYLLFLGIAYLFISILELFHSLAFEGMNIFHHKGSNIATQLWISARYLESFSLLIAPLFLKRSLRIDYVITCFSIICISAITSIFWLKIFPDCYIEGSGLTAFKKNSEYLICLIMIAAMIFLVRRRDKFEQNILKLLIFAISFNIAAELAFTFYIEVKSPANMIGHFLKIISYFLIYKAIIENGLEKPYNLLFWDLKQSETRYRNIYTTAPLAFVVWDRDCRVIDWNKQAEKMFGWTLEEVLDRNFFEFLIPAEERPKIEDIVQSLLGNNLVNRSINRNLTKSGESILCEWNNSVRFGPEGEIEGALSLGLDITERAQAEEALQKYSEDIKMFAYSVTHDLKNPAISIYGLTKHLKRFYANKMGEKGEEICRQIVNLSEQISALIEKINTFIATKENPLSLEENISFKEICRMIHEEYSSQLNIRRIQWFEPENMPDVRADRLAMLRIMRNLIGNSLKYGGDNLSRIEIGYNVSNTHHIFSVKDDGAGLKRRNDPNIFTKYTRQETSHEIEGTGLGLAIVKEIAERQGGEVKFDDRQERGLTVIFSISKYL